MTLKASLLAAAMLVGLGACASDYGYNRQGRYYAQTDPYRDYRSWPYQNYNGRYYYQHPQRGCWYAPPDRDNNPPGPAGGPGTNWENPPGPAGGPGASPDRNLCH